VSMSGKAAAFGGRVADAVAEQVLKLFAANFAAKLQARKVSSATVDTAPDQEMTAAPTETPASELNGPAVLWGVVIRWLRSLFRLRDA
jgi:uncharacterized protein